MVAEKIEEEREQNLQDVNCMNIEKSILPFRNIEKKKKSQFFELLKFEYLFVRE